jgi:hypothetical protein
MSDCRPVTTPGSKQSDNDDPDSSEVDLTSYQSGVGSLAYLATHSRPDLAYSVQVLAQSMRAPTSGDWQRFKRVLRFLKYSRDWKLKFTRSGSMEVIGYSDADFANGTDRKSIGGYCFIMNGGAISWKSKKQGLVTTSTAESEYVALGVAVKEALWIRKLEVDLVGVSNGAMLIYEDNQSAIQIAKNEGSTGRSKHIDLQYHFLRDRVRSGVVEIRYLETTAMIADILTKHLAKDAYVRHAQAMGLVWF